MRRRVLLLAVIVLVLTVVAHPVATARTGPDPIRTLGADSPLCKQAIDAAGRTHCRATGAIEHPYPLEHYRFDWHITTGITHVTENLLSAVQWLCSIAWMIALYALKGVLLMFQWAFSLDLLGRAMAGARAALLNLHETTLGQPWFLASLSVLGLWGIWRGFVQRRTIQTVAGLAIAVTMMVAALAVIYRPADTVGQLSRTANQASLAFLSGASEGTVAHPNLAISHSSQQLFQTIVLRPWCALEFADVRWCLSRAPGDRLTHAERFLRYTVDTPERNAEYNILHDSSYRPDDPDLQRQLSGYHPAKADVAKVDIQGKSRTVTRAVILALVLVGQTGCIVLVGWLAFKVLLQGLLTLVLLLLAPVMLFAPAFGDAGRNGFRKWALGLIAAIVSKAVYALFLALVLAVASMLAELDTAFPWAVLWILEGVFWWGILVKRKDLLAWASFGGGADPSVGSLYYRVRSAQMTAKGVASLAGATAGRAYRRGGDAASTSRDRLRARSAAEGQAVKALSEEQLRERARERLEHQYGEHQERVARHDDAEKKIASINRDLRGYDRRVESARAKGQSEGDIDASAKERKLAAQRRALREHLMPRHEVSVARRFIETADRNQVEEGRRFTEQQIAVAATGIRADLQGPNAPGSETHAWRAGIPAREISKLSPDARQSLHRRIGEDIQRDRALLRGTPQDGERVPPRADRRAAARALGDHKRIGEHRAEVLRERRQQRKADALARRELQRLHRRTR